MSLNPFPEHVGGGQSETQKAYRVLRSALGKGGSAVDDRGIDGLWLRSLAHGMAAMTSPLRRAALQWFIWYATDTVPSHERALGIVPAEGQSSASRRQAVVDKEFEDFSALMPEVSAWLSELDSRLSVYEQSEDRAIVTQFGRAFGPHEDGLEQPWWPGETGLPGFSTHLTLYVLFDVGYAGGLTKADETIRQRAFSGLCARMPSWCDVKIFTSVGFISGVSPLGLTGVSS